MTASDTLNKAAAVLLEHGHHKGSYFAPGGHGVCLLGAVTAVLGQYAGDWNGNEDQIDHVSLYIEQVIDYWSVPDWNDRPETTFDMAYGALLEAALLAKERGD